MGILPFEPAFYQANGGNAEYVGNPSVAEIARQLASAVAQYVGGVFFAHYGYGASPAGGIHGIRYAGSAYYDGTIPGKAMSNPLLSRPRCRATPI